MRADGGAAVLKVTTILWVDDDPAFLGLVARAAEDIEGVELLTSKEPFGIEVTVRNYEVDIVVLDVRWGNRAEDEEDRTGINLLTQLESWSSEQHPIAVAIVSNVPPPDLPSLRGYKCLVATLMKPKSDTKNIKKLIQEIVDRGTQKQPAEQARRDFCRWSEIAARVRPEDLAAIADAAGVAGRAHEVGDPVEWRIKLGEALDAAFELVASATGSYLRGEDVAFSDASACIATIYERAHSISDTHAALLYEAHVACRNVSECDNVLTDAQLRAIRRVCEMFWRSDLGALETEAIRRQMLALCPADAYCDGIVVAVGMESFTSCIRLADESEAEVTLGIREIYPVAPSVGIRILFEAHEAPAGRVWLPNVLTPAVLPGPKRSAKNEL